LDAFGVVLGGFVADGHDGDGDRSSDSANASGSKDLKTAVAEQSWWRCGLMVLQWQKWWHLQAQGLPPPTTSNSWQRRRLQSW
jgi:hypothetical protein